MSPVCDLQAIKSSTVPIRNFTLDWNTGKFRRNSHGA